MIARITLTAIATLSLLSAGLMAGTNATPGNIQPGNPAQPGPIMTCEDSCAAQWQAALDAAAAARRAAIDAADDARDEAYQEADDWEALCELPAYDFFDCLVFTHRANGIREDADEAHHNAVTAANRAHGQAVSAANDWYDVCLAICAGPGIA